MTLTGWMQIALVLGAVVLCAWPLGLYMARVFQAHTLRQKLKVSPGDPDLIQTEAGIGYRLVRPQD